MINDDYLDKRTMLSEKEIKILDKDLQEKIFPDTKAIIAHIKGKFRVKYSRGGMTNLLHRLGFSFKKPKGVPGKADRKEQEKFVKKYNKVKSLGGLIYFADTTCKFSRALRRKNPDDKSTLICDNAGYYKAKKVR